MLTITPQFKQLMKSQTVGMDRFLDRLEGLNHTVDNWPPYDLTQEAENSYKIEMALAGFTEDMIDIEFDVNNQKLKIEGNRIKEKEEPDDIVDTFPRVLHQGISRRKFKKVFDVLGDMEVTEARMSDGVLTVVLVKNKNQDSIQRIEIKKE